MVQVQEGASGDRQTFEVILKVHGKGLGVGGGDHPSLKGVKVLGCTWRIALGCEGTRLIRKHSVERGTPSGVWGSTSGHPQRPLQEGLCLKEGCKGDMTDWRLNFFTDSESKACSPNEGPQPAQSEPSTAEQETPTSEGVQPASPSASGTDQATQDELLPSDAHPDDTGTSPRVVGNPTKSGKGLG